MESNLESKGTDAETWSIQPTDQLFLLLQFLQLLNQKLGYFGFTNLIEISLYVFSLLLTIDFSAYHVKGIAQLTAGRLNESVIESLEGFQADTGLRQVNRFVAEEQTAQTRYALPYSSLVL